MTATSKSPNRVYRIYIRKELDAELRQQAERLGVEVADLIKLRAESPAMQEMQGTLKNLAERTQHLELILMRLCSLLEGNSMDAAWVRGAIEVQSSRNPEATKRAEELETRRLQMAQKVQEEINRYL